MIDDDPKTDSILSFRQPIRSARVRQVIEVVTGRGVGTPYNPIRQVTKYYGFDGTFLAERDDHDEAVKVP